MKSQIFFLLPVVILAQSLTLGYANRDQPHPHDHGIGENVHKQHIVGGVSQRKPFSAASSEISEALRFAACSFRSRTGRENEVAAAMTYELACNTSDVEYTEQLTAGMTYQFFNVPLTVSPHPNPQGERDCNNLESARCDSPLDFPNGKASQRCRFVVQYQAWMKPNIYRVIESNCIAV